MLDSGNNCKNLVSWIALKVEARVNETLVRGII
jgi:hypothetical protein